jgi:ribonuclease HI
VRQAYNARCSISSDALVALQEAADALADPAALWRPAWTPPSVLHLFTDASETGWGAVLEGPFASSPQGGPWPVATPSGRGFINRLELAAVDRALEALASPLSGHLVHLHLDSQVALAVLRRGSRVPHLHALALAVWRRAACLNIRLVGFTWVPTADNPADAPSRAWEMDDSPTPAGPVRVPRERPDDWGLTAACVARLQRLWGPSSVDAFATAASARLPRFWSRWPEAGAAAVDAFAQDWSSQRLLLVPPLRLLARTLAMLASSGAHGILVAPEWPAQSWWLRLRELAVAWTPLGVADFRLVDGYAEPLAQPAWRTWAVLVDGRRARSTAWA